MERKAMINRKHELSVRGNASCSIWPRQDSVIGITQTAGGQKPSDAKLELLGTIGIAGPEQPSKQAIFPVVPDVRNVSILHVDSLH